MILRVCLCQVIEGASLREIVVRVDDSACLRRFTRIRGGPMLNYSTLCRLRNVVRPQTWEQMNQALARAAAQQGQITGVGRHRVGGKAPLDRQVRQICVHQGRGRTRHLS